MRLKDHVILITGSTRGIGRAIAERCIAEGARVMITDLPAESNAGADFVKTHGIDRAAFVADDLRDPAAPARLIDAAINKFGKLDGLVNNAAMVTRSDLSSTTAELFDEMMAVNVRAAMLMIQAAAPHLEKTRGRVVNIGSINAWCGERVLLAYSMTKGALMTMSRNLGDALGPRGVRVNQVNFGWVLTEKELAVKIEDGLPEDWPTRLPTDRIPAGRMTTPQDAAAAVVYWVSDESFPASGSVVDFEQFPVLGRNPVKEV
ncbi:SDR family oxidoreductase [Planctomycetales bacterium ZRK34]|nr:SDR family oxidoreductase [Planctomycetales bacterium ZRK34]